MLKVVEKTKVWFAISLTVIIIGLGFIAFKGLNFGIDFKGGTVLTINMGKDVTNSEIDGSKEIIDKYTKNYSIRETNSTEIEVILQTDTVDDAQIDQIKQGIKEKFSLGDNYLVGEENISGSIGKELTKKAIMASIIACVAIAVYVSIRFEFEFGVAAIVSLIHDLLVTLSIYAVFSIRLNSPFIAAMMTILGYSINDTIVVFDRIRENRKKLGKISNEELVDISITQTMRRSINTSLSTLLTIIMLVVLVPSIRELTIPLTLGIMSGTYSSIFIASPVWVLIKNREDKKGKNKKKNKNGKIARA